MPGLTRTNTTTEIPHILLYIFPTFLKPIWIAERILACVLRFTSSKNIQDAANKFVDQLKLLSGICLLSVLVKF